MLRRSAAQFVLLSTLVFMTGHLSPAAETDVPGECKINDSSFNTEEAGCLDFSSGLVWSLGPLNRLNYAGAQSYCSGLREADRTGWRLPRRSELIAVAGEAKARRYFAFRLVDFFWGEVSGNSTDGWLVDLTTGDRVHESRETFQGRAVCVREPADVDGDHVPDSSDKCNQTPAGASVSTTGGRKGCAGSEVEISATEARAIQRMRCRVESQYFQSQGGGCQHRSSGTVWSLPATSDLTYEAAGRYCHDLSQAGHRDWRLPTFRELTAISGGTDNNASAHFSFNVNRAFWAADQRSERTHYYYNRPALNSTVYSTFIWAKNIGADTHQSYVLQEHRSGSHYGQDYNEVVPNATTRSQKHGVLCVR